MAIVEEKCPIQLEPMPQLIEAKDGDEDWTGVINIAERRRLQTRLNMRAYRRRRGKTNAGKAVTHLSTALVQNNVPFWNEQSRTIFYMPVSVAKKRYPKWRPVIPAETAPDKCIIFPLSSDHLIRLIQFNMLRACLINYHICAPFLAEKAHDCTNGSLSVCQGLDYPDEVPSTLWPTAMQRTVPHAGWIEIFPHPTWRNNFIQAAGTYEESDLCDDLYGGLFTGAPDSDCERRGIVVWSPAWSFEGWELSEGFVRKWGWSLRGCEDLLEATNRWRALRGEKRIAPTTIESEEFLAVQRVGNAS